MTHSYLLTRIVCFHPSQFWSHHESQCVVMSHHESQWVMMSHHKLQWVMISHHKSQWVTMRHQHGSLWRMVTSWLILIYWCGSSAFIPQDRPLSRFKNSDRIVRFHPWDRPLSPRIVCFDPKIVCFDPKRPSALTKDRLLLLGSSALTHGSSAFDLDRLLWSFLGSSALTLKDRLLSTLLLTWTCVNPWCPWYTRCSIRYWHLRNNSKVKGAQ